MSLSPAEARAHEHRVRVRYAETDQMGVVHHSNYALYLEEARTAHLERLGSSYAALERSGVGLVVRKLEVRYRAPARYAEELVVRSRISKLGAASVTFEYEIEGPASPGSQALRIAEARTELACVDLADAARPPRMLPAELRQALERHLSRADEPVP